MAVGSYEGLSGARALPGHSHKGTRARQMTQREELRFQYLGILWSEETLPFHTDIVPENIVERKHRTE